MSRTPENHGNVGIKGIHKEAADLRAFLPQTGLLSTSHTANELGLLVPPRDRRYAQADSGLVVPASLKQWADIREARQIIPEEYAGYFRTVDGKREFNFDDERFKALEGYGTDALNGMLRVRAAERNKGFKEMELLGQMSLQEMVDYLQKPQNRELHLRNAKGKERRELLLPNDYPTTTAKKKNGDAGEIDAEENLWGQMLFYHDTRLVIKGILASKIPDRVEYAKGIIKNFVYQIYLLDYVGNGSSIDILSRSQMPFLPTMAWDVFEAMQAETPEENTQKREENIEWLRTVMKAAQHEYKHYWNNSNHTVDGSLLITPGDADLNYQDNSAAEETRDMNREHYGRDHDFVNPRFTSAFINYPRMFARFEEEFGDKEEARKWKAQEEAMEQEFRDRMWDGKSFRARDVRGTGLLSNVIGLSQYMPMYIGFATTEEAKLLVGQLDRFVMPYGHAGVDIETIPPKIEEKDLKSIQDPLQRYTILQANNRSTQWTDWGEKEEEQHPNDFPIQTHELIVALRNYGYIDEAINATEKELFAATNYFENLKKENERRRQVGEEEQILHLPEKRNALTGEKGGGGHYEGQIGFAWSFALVIWASMNLKHLYELRNQRDQAKSSPVSSTEVFAAK